MLTSFFNFLRVWVRLWDSLRLLAAAARFIPTVRFLFLAGGAFFALGLVCFDFAGVFADPPAFALLVLQKAFEMKEVELI